MAAAALAITVGIWHDVLIGRASIIQGSELSQVALPWSAAPHPPVSGNPILLDPVAEFLPWLVLEREALLHGRLPLWNPYSQSGAPLLANDQSATFSPFNLVALPFPPALGLSLAALLKLWVAGLGTALFLRLLGARPLAAAAGGVAYAASSYMIVWLAWPHTAVAAVFPWLFAGVEYFVQSRRRWVLAAIALGVAVQFFAGHAETSLLFGLALAVYCAVRGGALGTEGWRLLAGLAAAAAIGFLAAGAQLLPFLDVLRTASLASDRAAMDMSAMHAPLKDLLTFLAPNQFGNPALDGKGGTLPNYNEATGYVTVAALVLAPIGIWGLWARSRVQAAALGAMLAFCLLAKYTAATEVINRLPFVSLTGTARMISAIDFGLAVAGALGIDLLLRRQDGARPRLGRLAGLLAAGGLLVVGLAGLEVVRLRGGVDSLLPNVHSRIGFWVALAVVSFGTATCLVAAGLLWNGRMAAWGASAMILLEAAIFAGPYVPPVPLDQVPPPSAAAAWLRDHQGQSAISATGTILLPEASVYYGIHDTRSYDIATLLSRYRAFWRRADPGYEDASYVTHMANPDLRWLQRAGVRYFVTPVGSSRPGTVPEISLEGVTISSVPGARPFAYVAQSVQTVTAMSSALDALTANPDGPVVVEGGAGRAATGEVTVRSRNPERIELALNASAPGTLVVLQDYTKDWVASIDGTQTAIHPADVTFQSVDVPAGSHRVVLSYAPASVGLGAVLSLVGLLLVAGLALSPRRWWSSPDAPRS